MKKIRKISWLVWALILMSVTGMQAQVTIGSQELPHAGAVLDLSKTSNLGLLLPQVPLSGLGSWSPVAGEEEEGMIVYNTAAGIGDGKGLYIWTGLPTGWKPLRSSGISDATLVSSFTVTPATIETVPYGTYTVTANNFLPAGVPPAGATYKGVTWAITSGATLANIVTQSATSCSVRVTGAGTITVRATSIDNAQTRECTITATAPTYPVTDFALNTYNQKLLTNSITRTITASVFVSDGNIASDKTVTWSVIDGDEALAEATFVTSTTTAYTLTSGAATGTFTLRASSTSNPAVYKDCVVTLIDCTAILTDYEGNTYPTVQIGDQCWMAKNLASVAKTDGTAIGSVKMNPAWNQSNGAVTWTWDGNTATATKGSATNPTDGNLVFTDHNYPSGTTTGTYAYIRSTYGLLYNTSQASTACPAGWKLPATADVNKLATDAGGVQNLKSVPYRYRSGNGNATDWDNGTDFTGFNLLPAGFCSANGTETNSWCNESQIRVNNGELQTLKKDGTSFTVVSHYSDYFSSVRCMLIL
jgi:uncharacterized protein (TIGR02145 family)